MPAVARREGLPPDRWGWCSGPSARWVSSRSSSTISSTSSLKDVLGAAVTPGNVGVCFDILSYAGDLVVTVVADPDIVAEQDQLTSLLAEEFTGLLT